MNWRNATDYECTLKLDAKQWAWEFLRRNHEYRQDYAWFIQCRETLEQRYGMPPQRDFQSWKQDPLAWRRLHANSLSEHNVVTDDEELLIECWMGQKWGFYKFPLDPVRAAPVAEDELLWREHPQPAVLIEQQNLSHYVNANRRIGIGFDLALPLKPQFEQARRLLATRQLQWTQTHPGDRQTVSNLRRQWTLCLRILDGLEQAPLENVIFILEPEADDLDLLDLSSKARQLCIHEYLHIAALPL